MKQKTRFKNFENIGYQSMNGRYIGIGIAPKKPYRSISNLKIAKCVHCYFCFTQQLPRKRLVMWL